MGPEEGSGLDLEPAYPYIVYALLLIESYYRKVTTVTLNPKPEALKSPLISRDDPKPVSRS